MLLMPDKKKTASIIVARMKPDFVQKIGEKSERKEFDKDEIESFGEEESTATLGLVSSAERIIDAVKSNDSKALISAMKSFVELCGYEKDDDE